MESIIKKIEREIAAFVPKEGREEVGIVRAVGDGIALIDGLTNAVLTEIRAAKCAPRVETARKNPTLISGSRSLKDGILIDRTGKRALLDMYQKIIG